MVAMATITPQTGSGASAAEAPRAILIDRVMGPVRVSLATAADVAAVKAVPLQDRLEAASTYDAIHIGSLRDPSAPAIQFLATCDPAEAALIVSHA